MASAIARSILREPVVHFLALGALLFLLFHGRGEPGSGDHRIVVSRARVERLASEFSGTWQRPPTRDELDRLIDDYVKDEVAAREASALGLDRGDPVIRRRLREKLELLVEDEPAAPPTDAELRAWLDAHPESFRGAARADLAGIRPLVEREMGTERRQARLDAFYARLLAKYTVRVEDASSPAAGPGPDRPEGSALSVRPADGAAR